MASRNKCLQEIGINEESIQDRKKFITLTNGQEFVEKPGRKLEDKQKNAKRNIAKKIIVEILGGTGEISSNALFSWA